MNRTSNFLTVKNCFSYGSSLSCSSSNNLLLAILKEPLPTSPIILDFTYLSNPNRNQPKNVEPNHPISLTSNQNLNSHSQIRNHLRKFSSFFALFS